MKPFNFELAKQGYPVCTSNNEQVRILEIDDSNYPQIVAYVILSQKYKAKILCSFYKNGVCTENSQSMHSFDLFMEEEKDRLLRVLKEYYET